MEHKSINVMENYGIELGEFIKALFRRKYTIIAISISILLISIGISYLLPTIYQSDAIIVIENQEIPTGIVETTITGYLQERIELVKRKAFTDEKLWEIAEAFDLFYEDRNVLPRNFLAELIRGKILIETKSIEAIGIKGPIQVVLAMSIAFEADTPEQAQGVSNELAALFIKTNDQIRLQRSTDVIKFLEDQTGIIKEEITQLESKLAEFKQSEHHQLPELMDVNLKLLEKAENDIERAEINIRTLEDTIVTLEAELSLTKPHEDIISDDGSRLMSANERLSALTAEYLRSSARYSQKHPDIVRLKSEINALGGEGADLSAVKDLINRLTLLQENLSKARQKYSDDHPDVLKLKQSILSVERGLRNATVSAPKPTINVPPDNPRYVTLKTQLDSAKSNLLAENTNLAKLQDKFTDYENRLFKTPAVEREYLTLSRDYENAVKKYRELKDKLLEAKIGAQLESESRGERMTLYKSAAYPRAPESPNRLAFLIIGIFLGSICGVGYAVIVEYLDKTIHGSNELAKVFNAPPLAIIPNMPPVKDKAGLFQLRKKSLA